MDEFHGLLFVQSPSRRFNMNPFGIAYGFLIPVTIRLRPIQFPVFIKKPSFK